MLRTRRESHELFAEARVGDAAGKVVHQFVDVAPAPVFTWLERADDGVIGGVKVLGGVPVLRRIAATDMPARKALPQVNPRIAGLDAVFTNPAGWTLLILSLFQMHAIIHFVSPFDEVAKGSLTWNRVSPGLD